MRRLSLVLLGSLLAPPARAAARPDASAESQTRRPAPAAEERTYPFDRHWLEPLFTSGPLAPAAERFRMEDWGGAIAGFEKGLPRLAKQEPEGRAGRFLLALARFNLEQWETAGPIFEELYESYPLLAPYHAHYAARCRLKRGDAAGALTWAEKVPARSVPEAETVFVKLEALAVLERWSEVEAEADRYLTKGASGSRRPEAIFDRAQALEKLGRTKEAAELYKRVWSEAPFEVWSRRAEERLTALLPSFPPDEATRLRTHTAEETVRRGLILFDRNQNVEAESTFAAALNAPGLTPDLACKAHFHRAQSVFKQRQRARATPFFVEAEAACRQVGDQDLTVKALYQGARCAASGGDRNAALAAYAKIEADFPTHSYADDARLRAAEVATDVGDDAQARLFLSELANRYPTGDQAGEALWRLAFAAWRKGDLAEVHTWLDENLKRIPHEEVWYAEGRALYWKARAYERQGNRDEARSFYTRAVREYPLSVYALLALERMRRSFPEVRGQLVRELRKPLDPGHESSTPWRFEPRAVFGEPGFLRAVELARVGLGNEARRELAKLGFATPESRDAARKAGAGPDGRDDVLWITAVLLDRGRAWNASHAVPRYTLTGYRRAYPEGRGAAEWKIAYPHAFPELVKHGTAEVQIPAALAWAIMREESAFSPHIESFANALGLTQMLVRTAQRFSPTKVTREMLLDPAKNVELGTRFLGFLVRHFGGAAPLAIAGYNAGEAAVDRWLKERPGDELDEFMESVPYDETRNYTKRVLASYFTYSWLYEATRPVPELSFSLKFTPLPERVGRATTRRGRR